ncbi:MAG: elongation factor 4 [Candidatus Tectomicrobia bacterium]|nr:elongation factor 4 [Candidatus Tectomicrobia bacterium]
MYTLEHVRNFSIIAHIDHGKSTLADRLLEVTGTISQREMTDQVLDQMDIERERGITIKAQAIRIDYRHPNGTLYRLNLIDTPGHVDFSYEVSRSLAACEGVLLVVDAAQGIEAQTIANAFLALEQNLTIIPVINKIDLPNADIEGVKRQLSELLDINPKDVLLTSAKEKLGIAAVLEAVVERIPAPKGDPSAPLQALIFDSWFDSYQGAVVLVRVMNGRICKGQLIELMSNGSVHEVSEVGMLRLRRMKTEELWAGEVGYFLAGIKRVQDTKIGDTVTDAQRPAAAPLTGFRDKKPMVFSGLYPVQSSQFEQLRDALEKLCLNDSAIRYEPEISDSLGFGFRCGFLGLLHMEIVKERLEREFDLTLLVTVPTVVYRVYKTNGEALEVQNPSRFPAAGLIDRIEEPVILASIITPTSSIGAIMKLATERRGLHKSMEYIDESRAMLSFEIPLSSIVLDFYDKLKSQTRGYGSFDYDLLGYRKADLVKLDILVNGEVVDALSLIVHRDRAYDYGRELVEKMRQLVPRQLFEVVIQAAIGSRVIARESVKALRKNVTAKCYGGDITRKRKLLEKQKEGKKRMKQVGQVELPQEAFMALLRIDAEK